MSVLVLWVLVFANILCYLEMSSWSRVERLRVEIALDKGIEDGVIRLSEVAISADPQDRAMNKAVYAKLAVKTSSPALMIVSFVFMMIGCAWWGTRVVIRDAKPVYLEWVVAICAICCLFLLQYITVGLWGGLQKLNMMNVFSIAHQNKQIDFEPYYISGVLKRGSMATDIAMARYFPHTRYVADIAFGYLCLSILIALPTIVWRYRIARRESTPALDMNGPVKSMKHAS